MTVSQQKGMMSILLNFKQVGIAFILELIEQNYVNNE